MRFSGTICKNCNHPAKDHYWGDSDYNGHYEACDASGCSCDKYDGLKEKMRFWSVASLQNITDVEIEHFDPEGNPDVLEAYDVKMRNLDRLWRDCMDLPPNVAIMLYKELKKALERDGLI